MKVATKKLLSILFLTALLFGVLTVTASAAGETISPEGDPLTYTVLTDDTVSVSGCIDGQKSITIPSAIEGYSVTQIADGMFNGYAALETLTFEDGCKIETIQNAFNNCVNLQEINWGTSASSSLKEVTGSFQGCASLKSLTIPSNVQTIGESSFANCIGLTTLSFESGSNLTAIRKEAFAYMGKDDTTIPAVIENLELPASLVTLEESAFHCVPVKNFSLEDHSKLTELPDGFLAADGEEGQPGKNTECQGVYDYLTDIFTSFEEPFEYTPAQVAKACDCLVSIDLGDENSLTRIGVAAFKNQTHLTKIDFGENSSSAGLIIDGSAFVAAGNNALIEGEQLGSGIETLVFPANLTYLEDTTFKSARIKNIRFEDGCLLEKIPVDFLKVGVLKSAHYYSNPEGHLLDLSSDDAPLILGTACLESVDFGKNNHLTEIGAQAFVNQVHLTSIDFGTSVGEGLTIGSQAFTSAGNNAGFVERGIDTEVGEIETLVLPAYLKTLQANAFQHARVKNLKLEDGCLLQGIPSYFLAVGNLGPDYWSNPEAHLLDLSSDNEVLNAHILGSDYLESIDFGDNNHLTEIGPEAFVNQVHLTSIDFGTSVGGGLTIGSYAFTNVGNNAGFVARGIDTEIGGIETLVLPKYLGVLRDDAFSHARIKNLIFEDECQLRNIPYDFLKVGELKSEIRGSYPSYTFDPTAHLIDLSSDNEVLNAQILGSACLESIDFGENNHLTGIGDHAFVNQVHLTNIDFGTSEGSGLSIATYAFANVGNNAQLVEQGIDEKVCEINTLVLPVYLKSLGSCVFQHARVKNLKLEDGCLLTSIPYDFLSVRINGNTGTPVSENTLGIYLSPDNETFNALNIASNYLETIDFGKDNHLSGIGALAFSGQNHLKSIDFGTPATSGLSIGYMAFLGAGNNAYLVEKGIDQTLGDGIETLALPTNVNSLSSGCFRYARIKNLIFPENCKVTSLPYGFMAIEGKDGGPLGDPFNNFPVPQSMIDAANCLETIDFGENNSISSISDGALKNHQHLKKINFGKNESSYPLSFGPGAFAGINIDTLELPAKINIGSGAFKKARVKHLIFADGCTLTKLGAGFFTKDYNDENDAPVLETIDFGQNSALETISAGVFAGNQNLEVLDLSGTKVKTIEKGAFNDCGLTTIILPDTLETLNNGAFQGLTALKTLEIGSDCQLTKLEGGVFSNCAELTTVDLLNSNITTIDDSLKENTNLRKIIFPEALQEVTWTDPSDDTVCPFYGCGAVNKLNFPAPDPSVYSFDDDVFQFLNESGIVFVPFETTDENIQVYEDMLTDAGLSFAAEKWIIKRYIPVANITLDPTATVKVGRSITLVATIDPENASDQDVFWSSSDPTVATVDENGKVTAVSIGTAEITVTTDDRNLTATCSLEVSENNVTGVTVTPTTATVKIGESTTLVAQVEPEDASNQDVSWSSSDPSVATVDENGKVTAVSAGSADITVTTDDGNYTATCSVQVPPINVTGVTVTPTTATVKIGESTTLAAQVEPANASNQDVSWSSSDPAVATVDENGKVTAVSAGSAEITVTTDDGNYTATCSVQVPPINVTGVTVTPTTATVKIGENTTLVAQVEPANASNQDVSWSSSDPKVATVDENGKVTAVSAGSAEITVTTDDGNYTATCSVQVPPINVTGVTVTPTTATVKIGESTTLAAQVEPANASNQDVSWSSSDPKVATVDENGKVTAVSAGTVDITVTTDDGNYTATCSVQVPPINVAGVTLDPTTADLKVGESTTLVAQVEPANASNQDVSWSSSDPKVATVDENGKVTAVSAGSAEITVTTDDGNYTATCSVQVSKNSGGGGGGIIPTYVIDVLKAENGKISANPEFYAPADATVTVTVAPDKGYTLETLTVTDKNGKEVAVTNEGNGVYTFRMPKAAVSVSASFKKDATPQIDFVDVEPGDFYYDAVDWASKNGITNGTDATHFSPDLPCSRAQMVTLLWRAAGSPAPMTSSCPFTDVDSNAYYYKAVLWAVENEITNGTSATTFSPDVICTRAQAVCFLHRLEGSEKVSAENIFTDVKEGTYYYDAVLWAVKNEITNGTSATTFSPDMVCTRGQIVTLIYRDMAK